MPLSVRRERGRRSAALLFAPKGKRTVTRTLIIVGLILIVSEQGVSSSVVRLERTLPCNSEGRIAVGAQLLLGAVDQVDLELVPGVGAITAERIARQVERRKWDLHYGVVRCDELLDETPGIGAATIRHLRRYLTCEQDSAREDRAPQRSRGETFHEAPSPLLRSICEEQREKS